MDRELKHNFYFLGLMIKQHLIHNYNYVYFDCVSQQLNFDSNWFANLGNLG